jgi:uncharacterized protein involved in type VI secretion and phage assembly
MAERQKVYGIVVAVVSGIAETKDGQRVQVKFRSLPDGAQPSDASSLCRMAAGHLPEENDEVLVSFEHGDIDRPFVVGALWNGKDLSAGRGGKDAPRVTLQSIQKHRIDLEQPTQIEIVDGKEENYILIDTKNKRITIESKSGDVLLKAKNLLRLEATTIETVARGSMDTKVGGGMNTKAASIELHADSNLTLKSSGSATVTSFSSVTVTSSSSMTVSSSGAMIIKGSTVNIN